MRLIKTRLQKKTGKVIATCWKRSPETNAAVNKTYISVNCNGLRATVVQSRGDSPRCCTQVVFVPPGQGEFGPAKMEMLPIEVTQALSTWALAFCGPASSRPMVATLARSSFIYSSTCYETAVSLRASTPECARTKPAHRKLVTPLRQSPQSDRWIEQQRDPLLRCGVSTPLMTA